MVLYVVDILARSSHDPHPQPIIHNLRHNPQLQYSKRRSYIKICAWYWYIRGL